MPDLGMMMKLKKF